ncbi:HAD family hydrolase [Streptomyces broussonetiae]|uniref:HAD family hydrolase n=1 Tax=Streptomyces broussonetiae TaxID=2686304 RepID=UPI0035E32234
MVSRRARPIAFFDVDETLLTAKTMVSFRTWWQASSGGGGDWFEEIRTCATRVEQNRAYYRGLAGIPMSRLRIAGRRWYASYRQGEQAYHPAVVQRLARHRSAGHVVVLVSGSFRPALEPVAEDFGVASILCTELAVDEGGLLTGGIVRPMIGEAKRAAAQDLMERTGARPEECYAYGDHASDLPLLRCVGRPAVVGEDPVLRAEVLARAGLHLPATAGPRLSPPTLLAG